MRGLLGCVFVGLIALVAIAEDRPIPKPLKEGEKLKTDGWFGKKVLPKRDPETIRIGDWVDGKQVYWTPHNLFNCTVREDRDGFLRLHDQRREGWVAKEDMVTVEEAPAFFDKLVKEQPNNYYVWQMRGVGWKAKGEYDNAINDFTEAIRLNPHGTLAYISRGIVWYSRKEYDKAIADYNEAIRLDPKLVSAFNNRGVAWVGKKEYDKAITDFDEAIRLDPKLAYTYYSRGTAWNYKKVYDKAIADLDEAIRRDPNFAWAYHNRGLAWAETKQYDKAIANFDEAIRLDPKNALVFTSRGTAWNYKKEYDKAIADLDEAIRLDPKGAYAYGSKAFALMKLKQYPEAVSLFEKAIQLDLMGWLYSNYAKFWASCPEAKYRDGKRAVELAKKGIEKAGKDTGWEYFDVLAMAYAEVGDFELAVSEQRKAVEMLKTEKYLDPEDLKKAEARLELYRTNKPYRDEE